MKHIKIILLLTLILTPIAMIVFLILLAFHVGCGMDSMWSTLISILASLFFSALVSYIVQKINDDRESRTTKTIIDSVRKRELEKIAIYINSFISTYHDCEVELISQFGFIKDCYNNKKIDLNVITQNVCYAEELIKFEHPQHLINKLNDYMLNSALMRNEYNKMAKLISESATHLNSLNDTYRMTIFSQKEIDVLSMVYPVQNEELLDSVQVMSYLSNLFTITNEFSITLNIFVNYEWIIVAFALMEVFKTNTLEIEKSIAKDVVQKYIENKK